MWPRLAGSVAKTASFVAETAVVWPRRRVV